MNTNESILSLKKLVSDKEREIKYLKSDLQSAQSYKDQYQNLEKQYKLLRDKLLYYETALKEKSEQESSWKIGEEEREELLTALEIDNEKLRKELEKAMDSLQKCQVELSYIPSIRQQLYDSDQLVSSITAELDAEKNYREQIQTEREEIESAMKNILKITHGNDPIEFIYELNDQLEKIGSEMMDIQRSQENFEDEIESLLTALTSIQDSVPKSLKNAKVFEKPAQAMIEKHTAFLVLQKDNEELKNKASKYEASINYLNEKQAEILQHIQEQEKIYKKLNEERQELLNTIEDKETQVNEIVKELIPFSNQTEPLEMVREVIDTLNNQQTAVTRQLNKRKTYEDKLSMLKKQNKKINEKIGQNSEEFINKINQLCEENGKLTETIIRLETLIKNQDESKEELKLKLNTEHKKSSLKAAEIEQLFLLFLDLFQKFKNCFMLKNLFLHLFEFYYLNFGQILGVLGQKKPANKFKVYGICVLFAVKISKIQVRSDKIQIHGFRFKIPSVKQEVLSTIIAKIPIPKEKEIDFVGEIHQEAKLLKEKLKNYEDQIDKITKDKEELLGDYITIKDIVREQEEKIQEHNKVSSGLRNASSDLKEYIDVLNIQKSELQKDNELKAKHITSLESIIARMESNPPDKTEVLTNEINNLSDLLEQIMKDYNELDEQHKRLKVYAKEVEDQLRDKSSYIKKLDSDSLPFLIEKKEEEKLSIDGFSDLF